MKNLFTNVIGVSCTLIMISLLTTTNLSAHYYASFGSPADDLLTSATFAEFENTTVAIGNSDFRSMSGSVTPVIYSDEIMVNSEAYNSLTLVLDDDCTPPDFTYTVVNDCVAGDYDVSALLTDFGGSSFITISFTRSDGIPVSSATLISALQGQTVNIINNVPFGVTVDATVSGADPLCDLNPNFEELICHVPGEVCEDPLVVSLLPFNDAGNTSDYLNYYENSDVPPVAEDAVTDGTGSVYYLSGDEVVYEYTPDVDETIDISTTNDDDWIGLWVFTGCPFASTVGYHTSTSGATRAVDHLPVFADTTYYIVISTWGSLVQSTDYTLNITKYEDCAGTPSAGTVDSDMMVCAGTAFPLDATDASADANGLDFIWQSSPAGENVWTDIADANTSIYTLEEGITEATDFRLKAYCVASDATDFSNVMSVTLNPVIIECYCTPSSSSTSTSYFISDVSTNGALQDLDRSSEFTTGGYADYTDTDTLIAYANQTFDFSLAFGGASYTYKVGIWVDFNLNGSFEDEDETIVLTPSYVSSLDGTILIPDSLPVGSYRMRVRAHYISTPAPCGSASSTEAEDYILKIITLDECAGTPTAGTATADDTFNICPATEFNLMVAGASEPANNLERFWQSSPAGENDWTDIAEASSTTYNFDSGLSADTDFRYRVTCLNSSETDYSNVIEATVNTNITDCYCIPEGTNSARYIDNFSTTGGLQDIANSGSGFSDGGYGDFTELTVEAYAGDDLDFTADFGTGTYGFRIWVDWNNDGNFDIENEVAYQSSSYETSHSGSITVPNDAMGGETRMRIVADYYSTSGDIDPCETGFTDGEFEDYTFNVVIPSCVGPSNLSVVASTATTATLSFSPNGAATQYIIKYAAPGFDPATEGLSATVDNSGLATLTGLVPSTTYEFYIQAACGGTNGNSSFMGPVEFTTECVAAIAPWTEDFENDGDIPNCWSQGADNNENWKFANTGSGNHIGDNGTITGSTQSGGYFAWVDDSSPDSEGTTLISPIIDVSGLIIPELTFYLISNNEGNTNVTLSVDVYDGAAWNNDVFTSNSNTAEGGWEEITVDLSSLSITGNIQIRFVVDEPTGSDFYDDVAIDDVSVHEQPTCPKPLDLTVDGFTTSSADISWTAGGAEANWEVLYGEDGFDVNSAGTSVATTATNVSLAGLQSNTSYDVYVRAICSVNEQSFWQGPASFTTNCEATDVPFTQDFEAVTTPEIPNCGTLETNNGDGWYTSSVNSNGFSSIILRHKYTSSGAGPVDSWYFTQGINLEVGADYQITFKYGNTSSTYTEKLRVAYGTSTASSAMTNEIIDLTNITGASASEAEINFNVPADGVYYFGFQNHSDENQLSIYLDDIFIDVAPTCLNPTDLVVANITEESADVSWTAGADETNWEVLYGESGFDINSAGTSVAVTSASISLDNLEVGTYYDVYVRAVCSADDQSYWEGPLTFSTTLEGGYCLPEGTNEDRYIDNFSTTNGVSNISNLASGFSVGGYGNFTSMTVSQVQTQDVSFSEDFVGTTASSTAGFRIWVDWNQDGTFDPVSEVAYQSSSYASSHSGSFTVPQSALAGSTRMRIVNDFLNSSGDVDPCETNFSDGEFEDYTFDVIALEECAGTPEAGVADADDFMICATAPVTLSVSGATEPATGLDRNWQSSPAGAGVWTDIAGATSPTYVVADGISDDTDFRYVVTCVNSNETDISNVIEVTINTDVSECYCTPEATISTRYINNFSTTGGTQNVTNTGSGFSTGGYGDFTGMTVAQATEETVDFSVDIEGGTAGFRIWVDWNQDGSFDTDNEVAYQSSGYIASHSGSFNVPVDALAGSTRMRIVSHWLSTTGSIDPCETGFTYGEFEDYTFNVSPSSATSLNGTVNWNSNCGNRAGTVKLYTPNTATLLDTYTITVAADGTFTIADLPIGTYDVIVKIQGYLAKGIQDVVISAGVNSLAVGTIQFGDVDNNNSVNFLDVSALAGVFGSLAIEPGYNPLADANCDGVINFLDVSALNQTFQGVTVPGANAPLGN